MKYKMLFFNKGVLKNDLKRFSWIGILYLLFLTFALPLQILMTHHINNTKNYNISMQLVFDLNNGTEMLQPPMFILPIILALFLFRYIQNKNSVDMIHSLPIKRITLYDNHVFFGIMTLMIPVIITAIISCILKSTLNLNDLNLHFTYNQIFVWCGITILFSVFTFLFSVLIGTITGLSTAHGLLTCIFLLLPTGLGILIIENLNKYLFGINLSSRLFVNLSPITRLDRLYNNPIKLNEIVIYIVLSIFIYALGRFAYAKRDLESATNAVAFKALQPIFKYGLTFCTTLLGGLIFINDQKGLSILGYLIGGLIGYYIGEMIIKKSIKVFRNIKGYLIYAVIFSVILLCVNFDVMGYEKRIPDITEISNISFRVSNSPLNSKSPYYDNDNFHNIINLHNKILNNKDILKSSSGTLNSFYISYNLKNGKDITREYYLPEQPLSEFLKPIYESKEYKKINFDYLEVNANSVDKITISSLNKSKILALTNPTEINEVVDIIKTITLNKTYEEMQDIRQPFGSIVLLMSNDKKINLSFLKTNIELQKWLLDKNLLKNAIVMPEDINNILVAKRIDNGRIGDISSADVRKLKITDKTKIEACMQNSCDEYANDSLNNIEYDIEITPKNINQVKFAAFFDEKHAPDFIKEYFK
ncbi:DUF6449 domain-containing protein [Clostridium sp.]|uniref:DUF6449 domain-containing protein n=1 Tax=Clostridium sp. TaxID=1506 RepID=UPI003D6CD505